MEPRLLLSGVTLGELPSLRDVADTAGDTYEIILLGETYARSSASAAGEVFNDVDGDGLWDPYEHALAGVTVYADVNGDGVFNTGELSDQTDHSGRFGLHGLASGDYDVRVLLPEGHRAGQAGSDVGAVTIADGLGVGGLRFGLSRTGIDLGMALSELSMPESFKTGTRVKVPVVVTNHGDVRLSRGDVRLRLWVSEDQSVSTDDIRLVTKPFKRGLAPGESVRLELSVKLPDSLADFHSYLIVDAVGKRLRLDLDLSDNQVVSGEVIEFRASSNTKTIGLSDLNIVLGHWNQSDPYGGFEPGDGFVGIDDLNTVLGNWNRGSPPATPTDVPGWDGQDVDDRWPPWLDLDNPGQPGSLSGTLVNDPLNELYDWRPGLPPSYEGLEGWTVYLDQNLNGLWDADEDWTLTAADGSYVFTGLATNNEELSFPMLYYVEVQVPEGWRKGSGAVGQTLVLNSGQDLTDLNFGYYAAPQVGTVFVSQGFLAKGAANTIVAKDVGVPNSEIEQVVFFYDHDSDGRADDILGVAREGTNGYYEITTDRWGDWDANDNASVYAVAQDKGGHLAIAATSTSLRTTVEVEAGRRLVYQENDGTVVTVKLRGKGSAQVVLGGAGLRAIDLGGETEVDGATHIESIRLIGTGSRTRLSITTSGGKSSKAVVSGWLHGSTPLGALYAPDVDFRTSITMFDRGVIGAVTAGSINVIKMSGQRFSKGVTIKADRITGSVELGTHLRLLDVGTLKRADIAVPSADRILVRKDYLGGRVVFSDDDADVSLARMEVGRRLHSVTLLAASSIDTIQAKRVINSQVSAGAWTQLLYGPQDLPAHSVVRRGMIREFNAVVFTGSQVSAWRLGTVNVRTADVGSDGALSGLVYRRLSRYNGPSGVGQTVL